MSADLSRPAACRASPGCQLHLPIPTLLRLVSSLTGLSRLPYQGTGGGLASFSLAAVSSLHESRTRPAEVPFQKQHRVKKELRSSLHLAPDLLCDSRKWLHFSEPVFLSIKWASGPHVHVTCRSCGEGHMRGPVSREGQRQVNRWPWVREACAVREGGRVQRARGASWRRWHQLKVCGVFFLLLKRKKKAFLLYKDGIQVVLKRTKQRARVTLLQSGYC